MKKIMVIKILITIALVVDNNNSSNNNISFWSNGLVVKVLDSQLRGPMFKTTRWLQGQPSLSSFQGQ